MTKRDHAAALLRQGQSPSQIARSMNVRASQVMTYLCTKIGEGELRRSDIAFSLKPDVRKSIEKVVAQIGAVSPGKISYALKKSNIQCNRFDVGVYLDYRRRQVLLGDMYELVRTIEVRLHRVMKKVFISEYGEENWWRSGVPDRIRAECAALREKDPDPAVESYCYTHLIALREVLDKAWGVLSKYLPPEIANNKKDLLDRLLRLNRIRNGVMHPVRGDMFTEEDFEFVYTLEADLRVFSGPADVQEGQSDTVTLHRNGTLQPQGPNGELVSELAPVENVPPAPEEAVTPEQASGEEFVPSVKVA